MPGNASRAVAYTMRSSWGETAMSDTYGKGGPWLSQPPGGNNIRPDARTLRARPTKLFGSMTLLQMESRDRLEAVG